MNDVKKSALWALISIPISILFVGALVHGDGIIQLPYLPGFLVLEVLEFIIRPQDWFLVAPLSQYLGYFLLIYVLIKIKILVNGTKTGNNAKEQSEKDTSGPLT